MLYARFASRFLRHVMATCSTNVLLGVSGGPCSGPVLSPYENKIGGYPVSPLHVSRCQDFMCMYVLCTVFVCAGFLSVLLSPCSATLCHMWRQSSTAGSDILSPGILYQPQTTSPLLLYQVNMQHKKQRVKLFY